MSNPQTTTNLFCKLANICAELKQEFGIDYTIDFYSVNSNFSLYVYPNGFKAMGNNEYITIAPMSELTQEAAIDAIVDLLHICYGKKAGDQ